MTRSLNMIIFSMVLATHWSAPFAHGGTRCAVISTSKLDLDRSPLPDLIEAQLSQSIDLEVLNRADITPILAERALVLATSNERDTRRASGALLRVDVLAVLEARRTKAGKILELSVIESAHGLRLAHDLFVWDTQVDRLAKLIAGRIIQVVRRTEKPIRWIFAVPEFESGDLAFDAHALKSTYAELTKQIVIDVDGIVVVDLKHANQLAKELALSRGDATVTRPTPYYLLGRYRSSGLGTDRLVDIWLTLRRGDEILASENGSGLSSSQVAKFLEDTVHAMLVKHFEISGHQDLGEHPSIEADLLDEQARASQLDGDWARAISLASAALLLDPSRMHLHLLIFKGCGVLMGWDLNLFYAVSRCKELTKSKPEYSDSSPPPRERRKYALLGLQHLEHYVRHKRLLVSQLVDLREYWSHSDLMSYDWREDYFGLGDIQREIDRAKLNIVLYMLKNDRIESDVLNPFNWDDKHLGEVVDLVRYSSLCTTKERLDASLTILLALGDYDRSFNAQCRLLHSTFKYAHPLTNRDAHDQFLADLSRAKFPAVQPLLKYARTMANIRTVNDVARARKDIEEIKAVIFPELHNSPTIHWGMDTSLDAKLSILAGTFGDPSTRMDNASESLRFTPIELRMSDGEPFDVTNWQWLPLDNGIDVLFGGYAVQLMRRSGILEPIKPPDGKNWGCPDVVWDGRYLWVVRSDETYAPQEIAVIDPAINAYVARFRSCDGLPPATHELRLAPLSPGKICAVGYFGRTWAANLTLNLDESGRERKTVDVFYEAREPRGSGAVRNELRKNLELAFSPTFMFAVSTGDTTNTPVWVGRNIKSGPHGFPSYDSMIIDPFSRSVRPFPTDFRGLFPVVAGNVIYFATGGLHQAMAPTFVSRRLELTGGTGEERPLYGYSIVHRDYLHTTLEQWTTVDLQTNEIVLHEDLVEPQIRGRPAYSNHYGVILRGLRGAWKVHLPTRARRN